MNRDEILEKSKRENANGDERDKTIEQKANENGFSAIMTVNLLLAGVAVVQGLITGNSFADYKVFMLAFFIGFSGKWITKYIYTKMKIYLFFFVAAVGVSVIELVLIVAGN